MRKLKVIITVLLVAFSLSKVAFAMDDLTISSLSAYPQAFNSLTDSTNIQYTLTNINTGKTRLEIYNRDGNQVRTVEGEVQAEGIGNILWDGKDFEGAPVPEGYYTADFSVSTDGADLGTPEFQTIWGGWGNSMGKLYYPNGVTADNQGNIYVADSNNSRIQKFDENGQFIMAWGTRGNGDGQFYLPLAVDVDSDGYIYVADSYNHRIQKFDSEGNFIIKWGNYGSGRSQFRYPMGIAVDKSGNVFVSDHDNARIQKFDSMGNFLTEWGSNGVEDGQFQFPRGIAVDTKGNVFVADTNNNRIQKFDSAGRYLSKWGAQGSLIDQFSGLKDLALDFNGNVYVADGGNNRIQVFNAEGEYLTMWQHQFNDPSGVACDSSGNVYIADTKNHQMQKFYFSPGGEITIRDHVSILVDNSAPETEVEVFGIMGMNDWYTSDVNVSLSGWDNLSGIENILYSLDGGDFQEGVSFSVSEEGEHVIHYYATDIAGNKEVIKALYFKIDKTSPAVLIMSPKSINYLHPDIIEMEFLAEDDLSGVKRTTIYLDGQDYDGNTDGIDLFNLLLTNHEIEIQSENFAGLVSKQTVIFSIEATITSLIRSIERLDEMGEIVNDDIIIGLKDKLKTDTNDASVKNNLRAFINQVEAQREKEIPGYYADMLIADARYIINIMENSPMITGRIQIKN